MNNAIFMVSSCAHGWCLYEYSNDSNCISFIRKRRRKNWEHFNQMKKLFFSRMGGFFTTTNPFKFSTHLFPFLKLWKTFTKSDYKLEFIRAICIYSQHFNDLSLKYGKYSYIKEQQKGAREKRIAKKRNW